ncbi:DUF3224 domain-containing protein [Actinokineospora spheciospongiae]|uniref:DUF3224 domain-containing protein n=1 Tax=Actinokineospora spheciospongiae TaxID=909613 RepID=UPI000D70BC49|nr:DUF3224 domain-containing protein [Actinokineospora spheciospongiae]PWW56114.1 uncharacterized protein DUF3224 [Actinokineospora spheciospongiae]
MSEQATGTFDIDEWRPEESDEQHGTVIGRNTARKSYTGDLTGTSVVTMFTVQTPVAGSQSYVAVERITGTLHGRTGTFVLQHSATASPERQAIDITVVADSATGELAGLTGEMVITMVGDTHHFTIDYKFD